MLYFTKTISLAFLPLPPHYDTIPDPDPPSAPTDSPPPTLRR